jgi:Protein of unknown function DUF262
MKFDIAPMDGSTVFNLYLDKEELWLNPPYQRAADIWPLEKKQLLIDSLLNGFDIPKFYFHDLYPGKKVKGKTYRYAIIDGKQRLDAIWGFIENEFPLSEDIELVNNPKVEISGLTYAELAERDPKLKARFDSRSLAVVKIQADDTELIEEMFSRLNEAVPLSAAEKRNALRGPIPPAFRKLSQHPFFRKKVPFSNSRYRHYDLACKFLLLAHRNEIADLKKAYLDDFVIEFREEGMTAEAKAAEREATAVLDRMAATFRDGDELLRSIGTVTLYYILYAGIGSKDWTKSVPRSHLERFERARRANREIAEEEVAKASYELLEFDRWSQSPNDSVALRYRFKVLRGWLSRRKGR